MYRLLLVTVWLGLFSYKSCQALTLTTEDYPPFNIVDSQTKTVTGIAYDKVVEMMRRANEKYTLTAYPWSRAYQLALQAEDTCVFSTTRTPEREALFKWVGPLVQNNWIIFARATDKRNPKALEDLRSYVLGGYKDDAVGIFLQQQGFKVDFASYDADNARKLLGERIDFWATGELLGDYLVGKTGLTGQIVPLFKFKKTELYLACNVQMDSHKIEHLNRILLEMERDGASANIERKYR